MPRSVAGDFSMSVTGTNLFQPKKTEKESNSTQVGSNSRQQVSENEVLTQTETRRKHSLKLPALAKTRRLNQAEKSDLQALLRIRCYDFSLQVQGLMPKVENSNKNSLISSGSRSIEDTSDQRHKDGVETDKDSSTDESSVSSLPSSTVLAGQRVNLREKNGLSNQRRKLSCQPTDRENEPSYQNDPRPNYRLENMIRSTIVSLKRRKQESHQVLYLPKVDKYDITPENFKNGKLFKLNDLKSSSIYSSYKDSWVPHRDRYFMNNSEFFKALMQPTVLLRQPSPVAGIKINLKEHEEDSFVAAIQVAKETDEQPPTVDTEVTKKVEKIVIRLPPIC